MICFYYLPGFLDFYLDVIVEYAYTDEYWFSKVLIVSGLNAFPFVFNFPDFIFEDNLLGGVLELCFGVALEFSRSVTRHKY